ncbi:MAG: Maf family protein, partial [Silicimonas sp.]|nr:Maf family protein [Silicimonas sp.]
SKSQIRASLLLNANVNVRIVPARVDEEALRSAGKSKGLTHRGIADFLADAKARKIAGRKDGLVLGCDQVLSMDDELLTKPQGQEEAITQLRKLRGTCHHLYSAAVLYDGGNPVWRHVGHVRLSMRHFSDDYMQDYVVRNWSSIRHSVGGYKLEEEGIRLLSRIEGDHFHVLGLPLMELLSYLIDRGTLPG